MTYDISASLASLATGEQQLEGAATSVDVSAVITELLDHADHAASSSRVGMTAETIAVVGGLGQIDGTRPSVFCALAHGVLLDTGLADLDLPPDDLRPLIAGILPSALEVGRHIEAHDVDIVHATTIGLEAALRVRELLASNSLRPWDPRGLVQGIGAATAAAFGLRLDEQQAIHALGIASTQATGTQQAGGTDAAAVLTGLGAANGLEAAMLAGQSIDGPARPIEGRRGLLALMHPGATDISAEIYADIIRRAASSLRRAPSVDQETSVLRRRYVEQLRTFLD